MIFLQIIQTLNLASTKDEAVRSILMIIKDFTGAEAVGIRLREGDDFPYVEVIGFPPEFVEQERFLCARTADGGILMGENGKPVLEGLCGRVLEGRTISGHPCFTPKGSFLTNSSSRELAEGVKEGEEYLRYRCRDEQYESLALIPLVTGNLIIGLLQMNDRRKNAFSAETIAFLEVVCQTVGVLIEHKRFEERLQQKELRMRSIVGGMPVLLVAFDEEGKITFWNKECEDVTGYSSHEVIYSKVLPPPLASAIPLPSDEMISVTGEYRNVERVVRRKDGGERIISWSDISDQAPIEGWSHWIVGHNVTEQKAAEEALRKARSLAKDLAVHLQKIQEQERVRLSREIHDELGQVLTALKMDLSWVKKRLTGIDLVEKTDSMLDLVDRTIHTVKRITAELRPGLLDDFGLPAAVEWHVKEFEKRTEIAVDLEIVDGEISLDQFRTTAIYRIFQEAMTNIARHSGATRATVRLTSRGEEIELVIEDNGRGMGLSERGRRHSFGIVGMNERVESCGGQLDVGTSADGGVRIVARIPLERRGEGR